MNEETQAGYANESNFNIVLLSDYRGGGGGTG